MHSSAAALFLSSLPLLALGQTIHDVQVGQGGLVFNPDTIQAAVHDEVRFHFSSRNHSVAQSTFDAPCKTKDAGFFSGYQVAPTSWTIMINDTNAIWVYCSYADHCQDGMEMVINPVANSDTNLAKYKMASAKATANSGPVNNTVVGGKLGTDAPSGNSTSSSSSSSGSGSSTSMSGSTSTATGGSTSSTGSGSGSSGSSTSTSGSGSTTSTSSGSTTSNTGNAAAMGAVPAFGFGGLMAGLAVAGLV